MVRTPIDAVAADLEQAYARLTEVVRDARAAYCRGFEEDELIERADDERASIRHVAEVEAWLTSAEAHDALPGGEPENAPALLGFFEQRIEQVIKERDLLASYASGRTAEARAEI